MTPAASAAGSDTRPLVAVVDYGIGNLHSAHKALERMGADARLTADAGLIADAAAVVLPGVGAFAACMQALRSVGLEQPVLDATRSGRPFLGICVGMQMLFSRSDEPGPDGAPVEGLGVIPGTVEWIPPGVKRPQMQWNRLDVVKSDEPLLAGLEGDDAWVYFVHSLHGVPDDPSVVAATCDYGGTINAAFRSGPVFATQFHPEKSSAPGLRLLGNFVGVAAAVTA
ncbi:MAG: imidazole glycerol phosphate synthase subunit HisH [Ilumatobacter sp.]|nr:MAG: imidazole glycerol phosphate synthase subunit HisH [Ilumatobacter sp.]